MTTHAHFRSVRVPVLCFLFESAATSSQNFKTFGCRTLFAKSMRTVTKVLLWPEARSVYFLFLTLLSIMDLLSGYDSSSDQEEVVANIVTKHVVDVPNKSDNKLQTPVVKKKRTDISYLPPEILAALARGDSNNDSDGDDDYAPLIRKTVYRNSGETNDTKCALLSMLPVPKQGTYVESVSTTDAFNKVQPKVEAFTQPIKSGFNFAYTSTSSSSSSSSSKFAAKGNVLHQVGQLCVTLLHI